MILWTVVNGENDSRVCSDRSSDSYQTVVYVSGAGSPRLTWIYGPLNEFVCSELKVKKVQVHTLDIVPLRSESPPQKRSGMVRVLKGFQFYLHTHTFIRNRE